MKKRRRNERDRGKKSVQDSEEKEREREREWKRRGEETLFEACRGAQRGGENALAIRANGVRHTPHAIIME